MNGCVRVAGFDPSAAREPLNRWILGEAAKAAAETAGAIESYRFNDAASAVYRFVWSVFCDWHLELAKPVLQGEADGAARAETQATIAHVLDTIYALMHPFMPFLSEELWAIKGEAGPARGGPLALGPWPNEGIEVDEAIEAEIGWIVDLIGEVRSVKSEMGVPPSTPMSLILVSPSERAKTSAAPGARASNGSLGSRRSKSAEPRRPARCCWSSAAKSSPFRSPAWSTSPPSGRGSTRRSTRSSSRLAKVAAKLGNDDFLARAPEEIVAEHEERRENFEERLAKLTHARDRLRGGLKRPEGGLNVASRQQPFLFF